MGINIKSAESAYELLRNDEFIAKWKTLARHCSWGTIFQEPEFISIWYDNYKSRFELIFVFETDSANNLIGMLPLARERASDRLLFAGDHHSEYKTWLATASNGNNFADGAFRRLAKLYPKSDIDITFLSPNTPVAWLENGWKSCSHLQTVPRSLVSLGEDNTSSESLRKRGNKTRIRQMKRKGEVNFRKIESVEEFAELFDQAEEFSALRLSGLHDCIPAVDPDRKQFHLDIFEKTDLIHAAKLEVGNETAAFSVSMRNRDEMLLCITAMSPFLAKQSPSKIHLLMLGEELKETDLKSLDLSPGHGYKSRFSTDEDSVYTLHIFFNKLKGAWFNARRDLVDYSKQSMELVGIDCEQMKSRMLGISARIKKLNRKTFLDAVLNRSTRLIYQKNQCRLYSMNVSNIADAPAVMNVDAVSDLLKYESIESHQESREAFHRRVIENYENGFHSYSIADDERLLHFGWLIERQEVSHVYEVNQKFDLPPETSVLFNFYTHPSARGQKLYRKSLLQGLSDAKKIKGTKQVFIGVMANNAASRHVIESIGFKYEGSLFSKRFLGKMSYWQLWERESQLREIQPALIKALT